MEERGLGGAGAHGGLVLGVQRGHRAVSLVHSRSPSAFSQRARRVSRFLAKEEDIVGPYRFGVYDLLVLPPSFPYGGMVRGPRARVIRRLIQLVIAGKRLSLVLDPKYVRSASGGARAHRMDTALLAGDRSLVDVVVHELTHSWFGNGVT